MTASGQNWFTGVSRFEFRELNSGSKCDPEGKRCVQFKHIKFMLSIDIFKKCFNPEGWYGEGGGRRVQDGEHMYTCGGFILIFGKTNTIL